MTLSTSNITQPLDLQNIFVNYFAGNENIFIGVAFIFFSVLAAKFRMPNLIFGFMMMLFIILMSALGLIRDWIVVVILIVGLILYLILGKMFKN